MIPRLSDMWSQDWVIYDANTKWIKIFKQSRRRENAYCVSTSPWFEMGWSIELSTAQTGIFDSRQRIYGTYWESSRFQAWNRLCTWVQYVEPYSGNTLHYTWAWSQGQIRQSTSPLYRMIVWSCRSTSSVKLNCIKYSSRNPFYHWHWNSDNCCISCISSLFGWLHLVFMFFKMMKQYLSL